MALPLPPGLTPPELAFLCEMELVTIIPRQRMDPLPLLSGPTPALYANRSTPLPLHLALLLHSQRRANILPPPWLSPLSLEAILAAEIENPDVFSPNPTFPSRPPKTNTRYDSHGNEHVSSPPFLSTSTIDSGREGRLPYHWLEMAELLLAGAPDSFASFASEKGSASGAENVRRLLRDIREVRRAKLRSGTKELAGGGVVSLRGVGGMEVAETRGFVVGVVGGLRVLGGSREMARREKDGDGEGEGGEEGDGGDAYEMDL